MQPNKFQDITLPSEDTVQLFIYVSPGLNGFRQLLECKSHCGESFFTILKHINYTKLTEVWWFIYYSNPLRWRHNRCDSASNHQPHDCLLNRLFRRRSKKTWKLRVTGLCAGNSPGTGEFPAQMASYAENVSIWLRLHVHVVPSDP